MDGEQRLGWTALEPSEFDRGALFDILQSLCQDRHKSPFYSDVIESKSEHFRGFLEQQNELQIKHREELYREVLELPKGEAWLEQRDLGNSRGPAYTRRSDGRGCHSILKVSHGSTESVKIKVPKPQAFLAGMPRPWRTTCGIYSSTLAHTLGRAPGRV